MSNWYKRYPADFLRATAGMSLELQGAYSRILDYMYLLDTPSIPSDIGAIAAYLGVNTRRAKRIINELSIAGKLQVNDECITNERALHEQCNRDTSGIQSRYNRDTSGIQRPKMKPKSKENSDLTPPTRLDKTRQDQTRLDSIYSSEFEAFWVIYPRRKGKGTAYKAWQKAKKRAIPDSIMEGAKRIKAEVDSGRDVQYIPHPTTWLNRDGWLDESEPTEIDKWAALNDLADQVDFSGGASNSEPTHAELSRYGALGAEDEGRLIAASDFDTDRS